MSGGQSGMTSESRRRKSKAKAAASASASHVKGKPGRKPKKKQFNFNKVKNSASLDSEGSDNGGQDAPAVAKAPLPHLRKTPLPPHWQRSHLPGQPLVPPPGRHVQILVCYLLANAPLLKIMWQRPLLQPDLQTKTHGLRKEPSLRTMWRY